MKLKKFNKVFELIKSIILEENPGDLVHAGVNDYEFDSEVKAISKLIERIKSPKDASLIVEKVFSSSFGGTIGENSESLGKKIFKSLKDNKII